MKTSVLIKHRIDWIDAVKGMGIMLVIAAHISPIENKLFWYMTYGFMPIFFVMAGFTSKPCLGYAKQIKKKAKRLLIPYFFYGIVLLFLSNLFFEDTNFSHALCGLFYGRYSLFPEAVENNIPLLQACIVLCPLWFLPCMFLAYTILITFDNCGGAMKKVLVLGSIVLTMLSVYKRFLFPWSIDTCCFAFLFMLTGRLLVLYVGRERQSKDLLYAVLIFVLYLMLCKLNPHINFSIGQYGERGLMSIVLLFLLGVAEPLFFSYLFRFAEGTMFTSIFAYIGRHSLRLMCIHIFISNVLYFFFAENSYLRFIICLVILFSFDALLERYFNKLSNCIHFFKYL